MKIERMSDGSICPRTIIWRTASNLGKFFKMYDRRILALAIASSLLISFATSFIGCSTSGKPHEYSAEEWQYRKFNGHPGGGQ